MGTKATAAVDELLTPIADRADQWVDDVLAGRILSCRRVQLACKRYRADLARQGKTGFPFVYDREAAEHMAAFVEAMPHIKGRWAREAQTLQLLGWQAFLICQIAGWLHMKTGHRRFHTAYVEVPRKNGKSTLMAAVGLYYLAADGEIGPEVYSAASSTAQARIVFDCARVMALNGKADGVPMASRLGLAVEQHKIKTDDDAAVFQPIASQTKSKDGKNPHCALIDELHEHEKRDVWDSMASALGSREQPLLIAITTAGWNVAGICYEQRRYLARILDRQQVDESYFGLIFEADEGDDPADPVTWAKANPSLGEAKSLAYMEGEWTKAAASPAAMGEFLRKHLDIWTSVGAAALDMAAWEKSVQPGAADLPAFGDDDFDIAARPAWVARQMAALADQPAHVGVDLAIRNDFASVVLDVPQGNAHHVFSWHFLPEKQVYAPGNEHYAAWAMQGLIYTTPGAELDLNIVDALVQRLCGQGDDADAWGWAGLPAMTVESVVYDPQYAAQMAANWSSKGITAIELRQRAGNLNEPFQRLIAAVEDGRLHHDGNPVMSWMAGNTLQKRVQGGDFIYPAKLSPEDKIDGTAALLNAFWPQAQVVEDDNGASAMNDYFARLRASA